MMDVNGLSVEADLETNMDSLCNLGDLGNLSADDLLLVMHVNGLSAETGL